MSEAGYAFSKNEMEVFLDTFLDNRPRTWLKYDKAMEMSGYDGNKRISLKNLKDKQSYNIMYAHGIPMKYIREYERIYVNKD